MGSSMKKMRQPGQSSPLWKIIGIVVAIGAVKLGPQLFNLIPVDPPSPEIKQLAEATTMTWDAQQVFYRQAPVIEPKAAFFQSCQKPGRFDESLIALGCYVSNGRTGKIFLQEIPDTHFKGMMQVSAAHEMLHAAYNRLSQSERDALAPRLKQAARRVTDRHLAEVLQKYEAKDTDLYLNELHSHLGTELGDFGDAELDQHYRRYFADRNRVVALAKTSQAALTKLDDQGDQLKAELDGLETELKTGKKDLRTLEQDLDAGRQRLDGLRASVTETKRQAEQTDRQASNWPNLAAEFEQLKSQHNQQVQSYNDQVQQYQDQVERFNQRVDRYKQKVTAYNNLNREKRSLLAEIDASPKARKLAP
jgi:hypothetical protein